MTDVSVILPCYNGAQWISRAIESILAQTYENFELVIVDDGSSDDSKTIIAPYLYDERIRYIYTDNRGFSSAINRGIKESNGIFIGFIGQDDLWMPIKLESQLGYINKHINIDLLHSNYYSIDPKERIIRVENAKTPDFSRKEEVIKRLFLNNFIGFETVLVKRQCFDKVGFFDERMMGFSDHDMWLRIAGSFNIGYLDMPLVKKREHRFQLSKVNSEAVLRDEFLMVKKAIYHYPFLKKVERKKLASLYYSLSIASLRKGDHRKAKQELIRAIMCQPWKLKAVAVYVAPSLYDFILNHYKEITPEILAGLKWLED
jgi:glycosyltransferase involved in cell wall biosynthesis